MQIKQLNLSWKQKGYSASGITEGDGIIHINVVLVNVHGDVVRTDVELVGKDRQHLLDEIEKIVGSRMGRELLSAAV
jgi:hypothetical protein